MSQLDIDGLTLRCARGEDDLPALARVRWACSMVDRVDPLSIVQRVPAAEDLRGDLAAEDGYDPRQDLRVAECSGLVTGYGLVTWWVEADGARVFLALGWVDPAWRKRGIGTKLLHWAERRCREIDAAFPGPGPAFYGGNASDTELDAAQLLRNEGYRVFFTLLEMGLEDWQDLPDPTLPSGFVSRPLSPLDLPELFHSMNSSYSDHPYSSVLRFENWAVHQTDLSSWHVAWDEQSGRIAAQVQALVRDGRPEIKEVSVRSTYRRRGLARALIGQGLLALRTQSAGLPRLRTLEENPQQAWRLYESVGFRVVKRFPRYRKELTENVGQGDKLNGWQEHRL